MSSKRSLRRAGLAAATATACLALLGAEGGCDTTTDNPGSTGGQNAIGSACHHEPHRPHVKDGMVVTKVVSTCTKKTVQHEVWLELKKKQATGTFTVIDSGHDPIKPRVGKPRTLEIGVRCAPGVYAFRYRAVAQTENDPEGPDAGWRESEGYVITKDECRR